MALRFIDSVAHYGTTGATWESKYSYFNLIGYSATGGRRNAAYLIVRSGQILKTLTHGNRFVVGAAVAFQLNNNGPFMTLWNNGVTIASLALNTDSTLAGRGGGLTLGHSALAVADYTSWHYYEMDVTLGGSTPITATITARVDGNVFGTFAGATDVNASSLIDGSATANMVGFATIGTCSFMDFYCLDTATTWNSGVASTCTTFFGDVEIDALMPAADVTVQWTHTGGTSTNHFQYVNEVPDDEDNTYVVTSSAGQHETFNHQPITGFSGTILGAQYLSLLRKDSEGLKICRNQVGGSDVPTIEMQGIHNYISEFYIYYISPLDNDNGTPWTPSVYNSENFGVILET